MTAKKLNIARELKRTGLSQYELAYRVGVSQTTVWKWAKNYLMPSPEQIEKITKALGGKK